MFHPAKKNIRRRIFPGSAREGFTLIEILVGLSIFGILMLISTGVFLTTIYAQRKATAIRVLEDSSRFVLESMARDIRTGYNFSLSGDELRFTSTIGGTKNVSYRRNCPEGACAVERGVFNEGNGNYDFSSMTPPNYRVDYLNFYLRGEAAGDGLQPLVTITLGANAGTGSQTTRINLQTTVSQRQLDTPPGGEVPE